MSLIKTVREEIQRLERLNLDKNWAKFNATDFAPYHHQLCQEDKDMTLDEFYKLYPYYNPDYSSEYWKQEHNKWKEIWKQN